MAQYMLLLRGRKFEGYSDEELREIGGRYIAWLNKANDTVRVLDGGPLSDLSRTLLRGAGAEFRVTDGPFTETKELVGGYYLIEAPDEAAVLDFCKDNPHLASGGTIEVRHIGGRCPFTGLEAG